MSDVNFRDNIAIAIDGGGIKGLIVCYALIELEKILGVDRLIECDRIKVIAGTSTGAIIAGAIAAGMCGEKILELYERLGPQVFTKGGRLAPFGRYIFPFHLIPGSVTIWPIRLMKLLPWGLGQVILYPLFPARYSGEPFRREICDVLSDYPISTYDNPTLAAVTNHLQENYHGQTIIMTAVEVGERRTHFFKTTHHEQYKDSMTLVDTILASSAIPTFWEPIPLREEFEKRVCTENNWPQDRLAERVLVDGGVGSFGNPASVAAWEMCNRANPDERRHYKYEDTTILSFGTGTVSAETFLRKRSHPSRWWAFQWAQRSIDLFIDSGLRQQSRNILMAYPGIDLRRYQIELPSIIGADAIGEINGALKDAGMQMAKNLKEDRHALHHNEDNRYDPEGIYDDNILKQFLVKK